MNMDNFHMEYQIGLIISNEQKESLTFQTNKPNEPNGSIYFNKMNQIIK